MLYRAPVQDLKSGRIARRYSYTVVVMQHYPRFLPKPLVDEYLHELAPERALFAEFKKLDRETKDHDAAFAAVRYEERFRVGHDGAESLQRLSDVARERDVFLVCQCTTLQRCHGDLLLLLARRWFKAPTTYVRVSYPIFEKRVEVGDLVAPPAK